MGKVISAFQVVEKENEVIYNYRSSGTLESHLHRIFTDIGYYQLLGSIEIQAKAIRENKHPNIVSSVEDGVRYTIATLPYLDIDPESGKVLTDPLKEMITKIIDQNVSRETQILY